MELKSSINETWKVFSLGTLLGCFILLLTLDKNHKNSSLLAARKAMLQYTPFKMLDSHQSGKISPLEPLNFTLNPTDTQNFVVDEHIEREVANKTKSECNMFDGRWIYKPDVIPSYDSITCSFMEEKMSCRNNGKLDFEYEKWRWEARDCDIPLFNGIDMMERLRNKRMIIVGDSLNRNMWESLACLLYTSISPSRAEVKAESTMYKVLKAKDYNFTLEFYWSPFLIDYDRKHKSRKKVLVLDKPSPNSKDWRGADIMVFNSGHWWNHAGKIKSWDLFQYGEELTEEMPIELAYKRAMRTWAKWIQKNVDPKKTKVFFRSISAEHKMRQYNEWCYNVTQPMVDGSYVSVYPVSLLNAIETLIEKMSKSQVKYLNITKLSEYRIDAHPSVFRSKDWKNIVAKNYDNNLATYADCSHWCLPGVPDTWNRLLYASIISEPVNLPS